MVNVVPRRYSLFSKAQVFEHSQQESQPYKTGNHHHFMNRVTANEQINTLSQLIKAKEKKPKPLHFKNTS